jgi:hypothetical protein
LRDIALEIAQPVILIIDVIANLTINLKSLAG